MEIEHVDSDREDGSRALGTRQLIILAAAVLAAGLALGGSFSIGLQIGRGQTVEQEEVPPLALTAEQSVQQEVVIGETDTFGPRGDIPPGVIEQMRAEGASEEDIEAIRVQFAQVRSQFQGEFPQGFRPNRGAFGPGADAGGDAQDGPRIAGTIESIDGDAITILTPAGPQRISTIAGTRITVTRQGEIDDLRIGDRVTVTVVPGPEEDSLEAASITTVFLDR